jgi:hypothetical protein
MGEKRMHWWVSDMVNGKLSQLSQLSTVFEQGIMVAKVGLEVVFFHCEHINKIVLRC